MMGSMATLVRPSSPGFPHSKLTSLFLAIAIDPKNTVRINGTHYLNSTGYEPTPAPSLHRL